MEEVDKTPFASGELAAPRFQSGGGSVLGVGVDLVDRKRVRRMLERHGKRFLERCFSEEEVRYCMSKRDGIPCLAARLAAKEACFKAIGGRRGMGLRWRDFEVVMEDDGTPALRLDGVAMELGREIGAARIWLSLTHEEQWAAALVVITGSPSEPRRLSE